MNPTSPPKRSLVLAALLLSLGGCSMHQLAVNSLGDAIAQGAAAFSADDDPELIRAAAPFSLKLIESLLAESPGHKGLLLTLRLACTAADNWPARLTTLALATAVAAAAANRLPLSHAMAITAIGVVLIAAMLGSPVFTTLGAVALFMFWSEGLPMASVALDHYRMVVNPSLPMIPLFTLAGYFLAEGGAAIVTVLACAFFTSFSGASGVTIIALGGMLMPLLLGAGYSQKRALGLLAGAGSLGGMLPPGLPLVLYAIVARVSIEEMFLAGIVPGLLLVTLVALWGLSRAPRAVPMPRKFDWREARAALLGAKWELALPVVAFLGLFAGVATPVEAAALTAVYAFISASSSSSTWSSAT